MGRRQRTFQPDDLHADFSVMSDDEWDALHNIEWNREDSAIDRYEFETFENRSYTVT